MTRILFISISLIVFNGFIYANKLPKVDVKWNGKKVSYVGNWESSKGFEYQRIPARYVRAEANNEGIWSLKTSAPSGDWSVLPENAIEITKKSKKEIHFKFVGAIDKPTHLAVLSGNERLLYIFLDPKEYVLPPKEAIDVTSLGITPNSKDLVSDAINEELKKLSSNGGGALYFPAGTYLISTIKMQNNTTLHLDEKAVLLGSFDADAYPLDNPKLENKNLPRTLIPGHKRRLIFFDHVENAAIRGKGVIDAQGSEWRRLAMPKNRALLNHIRMVKAKNITIEGIILRDSEFWSTHILLSENININGVKIVNEIPPKGWNSYFSPGSTIFWNNADGINPDSSHDIFINNSFFHTGDDCVPIKNTSSYKGELQDVYNIQVRGCMMVTSTTAMKLGTETLGNNMREIVFEDIELVSASRVFSTDLKDGITATNITYKNIRVFECNRPFDFWIINRQDNPDQKLFSNLRNVLMEDVTFRKYRMSNPNDYSHITGRDANHTVEHITFKNVVFDGEKLQNLDTSKIETNEFIHNIIFE